MQKAPPTPKGFRDIPPETAKKRRKVINVIAEVLESNGFVPLETPTLEFAQTLTGKYGEEEKLIYKFKDRGDRELALRYDLTVPLARFIANNQNLLSPTFSRYQIGQVFRGENPQHGRYREFTQFDFDTVGSYNLTDDAKIIATTLEASKAIGLDNSVMLINDRKSFEGLPADFVRALDKLHKIGEDGIKKELQGKKYSAAEIDKFLSNCKNAKQSETITTILDLLIKENADIKKVIFDPSLARGLDYYTGAIFELKPSEDPADLTIGSGGRYDNLIGMFIYPDKGGGGKPIPAVGFSFGIDRIVDLL